MVITAPNITRRAGERATRAEAGVEAEGAGAEVGVGVEVGVEEAGEGGVAAGEYGSQLNQYKTIKKRSFQQILKAAGAEAGVEEGAAAEEEVTVEEVGAGVVEEVGAGVEVGGGAADMIRIAETQTDTMIELLAFVYVFSHSEEWSNMGQGTLILSFIVNRSFVFQAQIAM